MLTLEEKRTQKREYARKWRATHPNYRPPSRVGDAYKEKHRDTAKQYYWNHHDTAVEGNRRRQQQRRQKFFEMYGKVCVCCGETTVEFLTLDHVQGQVGKKRESGDSAYLRAIKEFRPDLYRTLCMNCNHSYGLRGYCPHQKIQQVISEVV